MTFLSSRWTRATALSLAAGLAGIASAAAPARAEQPVTPALPAAPAAPAAGSADPADPAAPGRYDRRLELPSTPAYFDDASRLPMAPIIVQPAPAQSGDRPTMWIGGLLVLVAVFLWNRSRRQEVERLEAAESRRRARGAPEGEGDDAVAGDQAATSSPDEDAAELASAAAEAKKEPR